MNDNTQEPQRPGMSVAARGFEDHKPERTDAGEASELARHDDPSRTASVPATSTRPAAAGATGQKSGVAWVRPSELMGRATADVAGRGIDFHAELARRTRRPAVHALAASRRAVSRRAHRLPPVTAFGRRGHGPSETGRPGIGRE